MPKQMIDGVALIRWVAAFTTELTTEAGADVKLEGIEQQLLDAFLAGRSPHDEQLIALPLYLDHEWELLVRGVSHVVHHCAQCGKLDIDPELPSVCPAARHG